MKRFFPSIFAILCICTTIADAQQSFEQSRFIGDPGGEAPLACTDCTVGTDGVTHLRFHPSLSEPRYYETDSSNSYINFTVQVRRLGGTVDNYLSTGAFRLKYNSDAFDPNIGAGSGPSGARCVSTEGSSFAFTREGYRRAAFVDTRADIVTIRIDNAGRTNTDSIDDFGPPPANFTVLGPEWIDYISMRCIIPAGAANNDAGLGFSGTGVTDYIIREYPGGADTSVASVQRSAFLLADNDLRGFRLDGKTWAEDYSRYDDGTGVRVKFSKGISTKLNKDSFTLELDPDDTYTSTPTIDSVNHDAGSRYATILFTGAVAAGEVRLTTSTAVTAVAMDTEGNALADDSFVAALYYDGDAPRVTGFDKVGETTEDGMSTWNMAFSAPINEATLQADNFCITGSEDVCPETSLEAPSIVSVSPALRSTTRAVVVINEGDGKVGGTLSIEPKRNAVLGADLKVVEDYQQDLRGELDIADTQDPVITLTAERPVEGTAANQYIIVFTVTADEPVPTIADRSILSISPY